MRRGVYCAALAIGLLMPAASASAHQGSEKKAGKYLAKVINAADSKKSTTGKVRVAGCKAKDGRGRHRHAFVCRVTVQKVYPNGTSRSCSDRSVTVLRTKRTYRRVKRTYMNKGGSKCSKLSQPQLPAQVNPVPPTQTAPTPVTPAPAPQAPPAPPAGNPSSPVPSGPPPGFPPLPGMAAAAKAAGDVKAQTSQLGYFNGFYYPWYYDTNGYAWLVGKWYYQGPGCNADYYAFWWWNGYGWQYYGEFWVLNSYYTEDQVMAYAPC